MKSVIYNIGERLFPPEEAGDCLIEILLHTQKYRITDKECKTNLVLGQYEEELKVV